MMSGRTNRFPFTAAQWQELEHQALIFKYMVSGIPIPPDLLFTIKRSCSDSPISSNLFSRQPPHIGWSCFQMGIGRKIDPEPGRCRRTDGKKWRCSKEAYPDSKYCERHMHRGKNRSRKPVEVAATTQTTTNPSTTAPPPKNPSPLFLTPPPSHSLSFLNPDHPTYHAQPGTYHTNYLNPQFLSSNTSSCRPPGIGLSLQDNSTSLILDSGGSCSLANTNYRRDRNVYGLKEEVDEHAFFSEHSGSMRSLSGSSSLDDAWHLTPLTISSSSSSSPYSSKHRGLSGLRQEYSYLQLQSLSDHDNTPKQHKQYQLGNLPGSDREEEQQKTVHRFFDEWPLRNKDSWLDLDDKSSNSASITTTRLSISIPSSSSDFPIFNSRTHNNDA